MHVCTRVEWQEFRAGELFYLIGEHEGGAWSFSDRSPWECRWHELKATPALIEIANALAARKLEVEAA